MRLTRNVGKLDQILRIGIGLILIYIGFFSGNIINDKLIAIVVGIFGIVNAVVGLIGSCPIYQLAGICTLPEDLSSKTGSLAE